MIGSISAMGAYTQFANYNMYRYQGVQRAQAPGALNGAQSAANAQGSQRSGGVWTGQRAASPETPVQPVRPVTPVGRDSTQPATLGLPVRQGADPAEMAVRMRIQPYDENSNKYLSADDVSKALSGNREAARSESAREVYEDGQCQTCEKRKYQDESDDMGVSFQAPTQVDPKTAAAAVRGHENEHVVREQAKAKQEGREVVSQSVTMHTDICPECGKVYVSGGETRTVTKAADDENNAIQAAKDDQERKPFSVLA